MKKRLLPILGVLTVSVVIASSVVYAEPEDYDYNTDNTDASWTDYDDDSYSDDDILWPDEILSYSDYEGSYSNGYDDNSDKAKEKNYKSETVSFTDESGRFSYAEVSKIGKLLESTSDKIGYPIAVYAGGRSRSDSAIESMADIGAKTVFGKDHAGVVYLYIDLDGYENAYDYMYSEREALLYYSSEAFGNRALKILKQMQTKFPAGGQEIVTSDIYEGLEVFCQQLEYYKQKGPENGCFFYDSATGKYHTVLFGNMIETHIRPNRHWLITTLVGAVLSLIVVLIIISSTKAHYKFKETVSASAYTSNNKINMRVCIDEYLGSHVTKVYVPPSDSGGGGGGGHGGGGFSSGGGSGSHR